MRGTLSPSSSLQTISTPHHWKKTGSRKSRTDLTEVPDISPQLPWATTPPPLYRCIRLLDPPCHPRSCIQGKLSKTSRVEKNCNFSWYTPPISTLKVKKWMWKNNKFLHHWKVNQIIGISFSLFIFFLTASPSPNVRYYPPPPPPSATHLPNTITTRVDVPSDRIDSTALSLVSAVSSIPEIVRSVLNIFDQFVNIFDHQVGPGSHLGRRVGRLAQPEHPHTSCAWTETKRNNIEKISESRR